MATISANALGVYYIPPLEGDGGFLLLDSDNSRPFGIAHKTVDTTFEELTGYGDGILGRWTDIEFDDDEWGYKLLLNVDGTFEAFVYKASGTTVYKLAQQPEIMAAATSLSVEASNTVNETVAHNGTGGSTTYIVGGAMSWSMSIDGLLDLSASGVGSSVSIVDAARAKYYLVVKFDTGTDVQYVGQALIDNVSMSGGVDDIATYSASFSGYGDLYKQV